MSAEMSRLLTKTTMSNDDIRELISMIDIESANSVYRRCADEFGFRIVELEGETFSTAAELAKPLGYHNARSVSTILRRHGIETMGIRRLHHSDVSIRESLHLSDWDYSTKLIGYQGFLTLAIEGKGVNCDKVREYLLTMEKQARTDAVIHDGIGISTNELEQIGDDINDPIIQSSLSTLKALHDVIELRQRQLEQARQIEAIEKKLPLTDEQEHQLNKKRDELIQLKVKNGYNRGRAYSWFYRTIKSRFHIGIFRGLAREKFPLVIDWIEEQIDAERAKLAQLEMPMKEGFTITLR